MEEALKHRVDRITPLVDISQTGRGTRGTWMEWLVAETEAMNELNK